MLQLEQAQHTWSAGRTLLQELFVVTGALQSCSDAYHTAGVVRRRLGLMLGAKESLELQMKGSLRAADSEKVGPQG